MEKEQYRSVIRFLFLDGKTCEEIKIKLHAVYKDDAPSMTTIRFWFNEFKRGRTSIFDEKRPGRPIEVTTEDMVNKIHDIVLADRRVKIREIANIIKISTERIQNVLHETLGMRKLSARRSLHWRTVQLDTLQLHTVLLDTLSCAPFDWTQFFGAQ